MGSCLPTNFWTACKLAKKTYKKLDDVTKHLQKGNFEEVAAPLPVGRGTLRRSEKTVGSDSIIEKVLCWLKDDTVGSIGLFGVSGVGKTTTMTEINNKLCQHFRSYEVLDDFKVLWVEIKKNESNTGSDYRYEEEVLDAILKSLGDSDGNQVDRHGKIFNMLSTKTFILLLDDLRSPLAELRILPAGNCKSKIIFTTQYESVCGVEENSRKIEVECLTEEETIDLFWQKVGDNDNDLKSHPLICKHAKNMAQMCGGLLLALDVAGRYMANKKNPFDWKYIVGLLDDFSSHSPEGMGDLYARMVGLYQKLQSGYDALSDDVKPCFLYCSLFPKNHRIDTELLVKLWVGEGLLRNFESVEEVHYRGCGIIEKLKDACLLVTTESSQHVKMPHVIHDMALWTARGNGQNQDKYFVKDYGDERVEDREGARLQAAVSLWNARGFTLREENNFPDLMSLFIRNSKEPPRSFVSMPVIKGLDLSSSFNLVEMPFGVNNLCSLQYLNLSGTYVKELPADLFKNLGRLKYLNLDHTPNLRIRPQQLRNSRLQVLDTWACGSSVPLSDYNEGVLEEVEALEKVVSAKITIRSVSCLQKFERSHKLQSITTGIYLSNCESVTSSSFLRCVGPLERLEINSCEHLQSLSVYPKNFDRLLSVVISNCKFLKNLNWLTQAPLVQSLVVSKCDYMEEMRGRGIRTKPWNAFL